jgi:type I restriction enzyme M protein
MVRIAMTDMRLQGDGHSNVRCTDALLDFANYPDLAPGSFDVVLTNPPFGSILESASLPHLGKFELAEGRARIPMEVLGLERSLQLLRPGGRLAIVLPDSILSNPSASRVREWVQRQAKVRAVVSLPIETFAPFGAGIKTSVLIARKWKPGEQIPEEYPVAMVRLDDVGYDATGRSHADSDLPKVEALIADFLEAEGW